MSFLIWLVIIQIAVVIHEFAHYFFARWQKAQVLAFSVGMGPVIWRKKYHGTEWRLSALPIGGYVEIEGMAPNPDGSAPTTGFAAMSFWGKISVLLAGPLSNFILAIVLLSAVFYNQGIQTPYHNRVELYGVVERSAAAQLGLKKGDIITHIDGEAIPETYRVDGKDIEGYNKIKDAIQSRKQHVLTVERGKEILKFNLQFDYDPLKPEKRFGIQFGPHFVRTTISSVPEAVSIAFVEIITLVPQAVQSFVAAVGQTFSSPLTPNSNVLGPVGSVEAAGSFAKSGGIWGVLSFAAMINASLFIFNLLPIPGLDGGRILLIVIQAIMRKPLQPTQEATINFIGFAFLMVFMFLVVLGDLGRILP